MTMVPERNQVSTHTKRWPLVELGSVCNLVNGDAYRESDWNKEGVQIIRIQNLNDDTKSFNYWSGSIDDRVTVSDGDVLLAWSGTPGTSFGAHVWRRGRGVLNQHIFRLDLDLARVDPEWAVYTINDQLEHLIGKAHGGVGLRHVMRREVERLLIPLPDLAEQRRIAAILNEQMAAVKKARSVTITQASEASSLCRRYLLRAFGGLVNAPKKSPLEAVAQLLPSKSISTAGEATVETVTTACLTEAGFDWRGIKTARMAGTDVPDCILSPGEVLVARSNTPELVGRAAMYPGHDKPIVASDLTIRIKTGPELLAEFLAGYLSYLYVSKYWVERAGGASGSMKKITRTQIAELPIPILPLDEQERIVSQYRKTASVVQRIELLVADVSKEIESLPVAFLRRILSGES